MIIGHQDFYRTAGIRRFPRWDFRDSMPLTLQVRLEFLISTTGWPARSWRLSVSERYLRLPSPKREWMPTSSKVVLENLVSPQGRF
jgi:hypothetical protein